MLTDRAKNPNNQLICAVSRPDFEKGWKKEWQRDYRFLLEYVDLVKVISDRYTGPSVYMVRNKWMVDHSARVIAVCNGQKSGTKNTIEYAREVSVEVYNILG